jgi:peptidoglycan/LPS O-acetylase OafA/YrhL
MSQAMRAGSEIERDPNEAPSSQANDTSALSYMAQLDGLRAIAVLFVLNHHFLSPNIHFRLRPLLDRAGNFSVRLFFVLSGFLITGILLKCRNDGRTNRPAIHSTLRQFYTRRFLRIFPLYYAVLFLAAALDLPQVRSELPWHTLYLTNIYYSWKGSWGIGPASHFWSLAVEEQFYLVWPLLILVVPRRALLGVIAGAFLAGPLFRILAIINQWNMPSWYYLTPANLDSLSAGALLAYASSRDLGSLTMRGRLEKLGIYFGLPLSAILFVIISKYDAGFVTWIVLDTAMALFFLWVVSGAARGFPGIFGVLLSHNPLRFIGRISYGVYVYHFFIIWILIPFAFRLSQKHPNFALYTASVIATLAMATFSFFAFEKPLNDLKRLFPYRGRP